MDTHAQPRLFSPDQPQKNPNETKGAEMTENTADLDGFLPGLAPDAVQTLVRPSYEKAIARLLSDGVIGDEHAGVCASIIALASIADNRLSKAYARNDALKEAHEQMRTLLEVAHRQGDSDYANFEAWLAAQQ